MREFVLIPTQSAASSVNTASYTLINQSGLSIHVIFTGSDVVGTASIQVSDDNTNWTTMLGSSTSVTASSAVFFDITPTKAKFVRLTWTYTSGTGNIRAILFAPIDTVVQGAAT